MRKWKCTWCNRMVKAEDSLSWFFPDKESICGRCLTQGYYAFNPNAKYICPAKDQSFDEILAEILNKIEDVKETLK